MTPKTKQDTETAQTRPRPISQKQIAERLGLNPSTVSVVLNNAPGRSIPQATRTRIKTEAARMGYTPNLLARSLRSRKTQTIGILVPELGDGYHTQVMSGIGDCLMQEGYFYFTAHHRHNPALVEQYTRLLLGRGAEALILIDTHLKHALPVPAAAVAGHRKIPGITNVRLDQQLAAELALKHLYELGHRQLAFMRGQPYSSDSEERWQCLVKAARRIGLAIDPRLVVQLDRDLMNPELGVPAIHRLLAAKRPFTAIVSFNDMAAMGAMRALQDAGVRVPQDVSLIGFDDIKLSAYTMPSLTTIHQPLADMGMLAARVVLDRLREGKLTDTVLVHPRLIVRESTAPPPGSSSCRR